MDLIELNQNSSTLKKLHDEGFRENKKHKVKEQCIRFINPNKEKDKKNATEEPTEPDSHIFGFDGLKLVDETDI